MGKKQMTNVQVSEAKGSSELLPMVIEQPIKKVARMSVSKKYEARDLSWMKFNERILDLAKDKDTPLLERLKFLSITASNLDEFIMVRMGAIVKKVQERETTTNINGMTPYQEYKLLIKKLDSFIHRQQKTLTNISEELSGKGYKLIQPRKEKVSNKTKKWLDNYFEDKVQGLIVPIVFDNSRPFPLIQSKVMNIGVLLEDPRNLNVDMFGTIQVPNIDRVIEIESKDVPKKERHFILLEELILMNLDKIFFNKTITDHCFYRALRNFDDDVESGTNAFLADKMKESLKKREKGEVVALQITKTDKEMTRILHNALNVDKKHVFEMKGIVDLSMGMGLKVLMNDEEKEELLFKKFSPQVGKDLVGTHNILDVIDKNDVFLHHPYESFDAVVDFIREAADNPDVLAIRQTLYRLSSNSPIMESLIKAAENGKQVVVLLEIKARFDEKRNLEWAAKLERAGGHVIYGVDNLKTHCKMTLITKRNKKGNLKKYVHIGTGNYNDVTSRIYTDMSVFTANPSICNDVFNLFNTLTGFSEPKLKRIIAAPYNLRDKFIEMIDREIEFARKGEPASLTFKVNSLTDKTIIDKLYEASVNGVKCKLIVRGACCLITGVKGLSENIEVVSNVGRFLEHSRVYYFLNGGKEEIYIASSDLMERNLDKRFEIAMPVLDQVIRLRIMNILIAQFNDSYAYELKGKKYERRDKKNISAQEFFCKNAIKYNKVKNVNRLFVRNTK